MVPLAWSGSRPYRHNNDRIVGLPETPKSLVERGHQEKARAMLERIRGTPDVQEEFEDLVDDSEVSRRVKHPSAQF